MCTSSIAPHMRASATKLPDGNSAMGFATCACNFRSASSISAHVGAVLAPNFALLLLDGDDLFFGAAICTDSDFFFKATLFAVDAALVMLEAKGTQKLAPRASWATKQLVPVGSVCNCANNTNRRLPRASFNNQSSSTRFGARPCSSRNVSGLSASGRMESSCRRRSAVRLVSQSPSAFKCANAVSVSHAFGASRPCNCSLEDVDIFNSWGSMDLCRNILFVNKYLLKMSERLLFIAKYVKLQLCDKWPWTSNWLVPLVK